MKSDGHKKERQQGKATRASARKSSTPTRAPLRKTSAPQSPFPRKLALEQLEPRLLLSADGLGIAPELALPATQTTSAATIALLSADAPIAAAAVATSHELVFVDPRVPDAKDLLAALVGDADPSRQFEIITLDPQRDGIVQVTAALKSRMQLDAVHFITHGSDGAIQLGGTLLDAKALAANKDLVSAWGGALKDDADLLFYGCDVASTARGRALVDWIADLTGADVAASTDKTGSAAQGGDWELEYRAGLVQTQVAIDRATQLAWNGVLATVTVSTTADVLDGDTSSISALLTTPGADGKISLREAIIAANNTSGADVINLASGLYQLTRIGANEDNANTGDLDIKDDLTITGAGANTTFIDGNAADRVFHISGAAVTISGVTIQNGQVTGDGGGVYLSNNGSSSLKLTNSAVSRNVASGNGGGIFSDRVLTLNSVTIDGNSANVGGGVYLGNNGNSDATLTNVTISGNSATTNGGGIDHNANSLAITNSTIAYNHAGSGAGGIHKEGSSVATLRNTILAFNTSTPLNTPSNSNGAQNSLGNNIENSNTAGLSGPGDKINTDPLLGPLQYNGGTTKTHALLAGSPAIDAGTTTGAPPTDQRGASRVGAPDIGAYEFGGLVASISGVIYNDVDGDANVAEPGTQVFENAVVRLYRDDGNGLINTGDTLVASATTDNAGAYKFTGLTDGTYYVVVDSTSLTSGVIFNSGYNANYIWAEQTYGVTGAALNGGFLTSDGALYGGRNAGASDNAGSITTAEHVTKVIVGGADVSGIDSGFSFNAVTSTRDGDDVPGGGNPRTIQGSLRQFVINSNAINNASFGGAPEVHTSNFSIGGGGPQTISLGSALPQITDPVVLDATSQEGFSTAPLIELNGASAGPGADGFWITAGGSTIRGFVINRFRGVGIDIETNGGNTVVGNWIGTNATGTAAAGNANFGIRLGSGGNTVGGTDPLDRNVISGNGQDGIQITASSGNVIQGNYIGTDKDGSNSTAAIGNLGTGIWVYNATGPNTIGGTGANEGNVISGNGGSGSWQGVLIQNSDGNLIQGNIVGLNAAGTAARPNAGPGIEVNSGSADNTISGNTIAGNTYDGVVLWNTTGNIVRSNFIGTNASGSTTIGNGDFGVWITGASDNTIGGTNPGDGNVIARNGLAGVEVDGTASGNAILGNAIYANGGLGIDLNALGPATGDGVTANDPGDTDGGPNSRQNYPTLSAAYVGGGQVQIKGTLNSTAGTTFHIEVFASSTADPSSYGEGERYLGSFDITTDSFGNATFNNVVPGTVGAGEFVSATATNLATNNTSEFAKIAPATNNTPPLATNATAGGLEDASSIPITLTGTDVEGPIASFRLSTLPGNGTLYTDLALTTLAVAGTDYAAAGNALTLYFKPAANWNGSTGFQFTAADLLGAPSSPASATIDVTPVNDPPTATNLSAAETYTEDASLDLVDIVVSDIDSANITVTLTLSDSAAGALNTATAGSVTSTFTGGVWTASGAIADVNTLLAGLIFTPAPNYDSNFTIATSVSDGVAPALTGSKTMTAIAVNDAPTATNLSAAETYTEDTPLNLIDIVVSDIDSPSVTVTLTLSDPVAGALNTATAGGVTSTFTGGVWTASGAIADVNALLAGLTFSPALNYNSSFTIATSVSDGVAPALTGIKDMTGTPVNDAPGATNLSAPETYFEDTPLNLTDIVVSDVDSSSVTVTLTLSDPAAGALNTATAGSVTSTFTGGVWTASGAIADVNTLLAGLTFTPALNYNSDFTIGTSVSDGVAPALTGIKDMTGTPVNDAPTVLTSGGSVNYAENDPPTAVDSAVAVDDIDNSSLASATVRISGGYVNGEDTLTFTSAGGITGVWTAATGTLALTGPASLSDWNTVLQSVAYQNSSENPTAGPRTIELIVNDGALDSAAATRTVNVTPVNDAPVATDANANGVEDASSIAITLTGTDVDSVIASFQLLGLPANGVLYTDAALTTPAAPATDYAATSSSLTLYFVPAANWNGSTTFQYTAKDTGGLVSAAPAIATIDVTPANDPPVAGDDGPYVVDEDASLSVSAAAGVLTNDSDIDSASFTAVLAAPAANGLVTLNSDGSFTYTPRADFYGTDTFTYQAFDGSASSNVATVTITVNPVADHRMVVDTAADIVDGDVTSIDTLLRDKGADGFISLREAILAANATANAGGPDRIDFDIAGPQTINVGATGLGALPTITDAVIIDGTTDPDFGGTPVIVLNGGAAGAGANGLQIDASGGSLIKGLVIDSFRGSGLRIGGSGSNLIQGNYIGVDASGNAPAGNNDYGIWLASNGNLIGGTSVAERNVVSASGIDGIYVAGTSGNVIRGNYIGTNATGTTAMGNAEDGVWLFNASNNVVGGTGAGEGNLISGNNWSGVAFTGGGADNAVQGNLIGVDATGGGPLGNMHYGVQLEGPDSTMVGGTAPGAGNVIAYSGWDGVAVNAGTGHSILGNTIYANGELGVDIGNDGLSAQNYDAGDIDTGPNDWMNFPVIYNVLLSGGNVTVTGEARPGALVEIFKADADPSGYGEGQTLLFSGTIAAGTPGIVDPTAQQFSFTFAAGPLVAGDQITATATDAAGSTSEFAKNAYVSAALPGITVTPVSGLVTTEDGGTATFTVVLDSQPNAPVTIALASDNPAEGTVPATPLAFDSSNWDTAQTVTVTGVADFVTDGNVAYNIVLSPAISADVGYNGVDPADISVTNQDGVNDAPVNNVPGGQIVAEDTPLVFSTGTGNAISIADSDAGPNPVEVTLSAAQGTLTLAGVAGLTFTVGTGTAETTMTFSGALADINAALDGLTFDPLPSYNGAASVTIDTNDQGASGSGGPQSDSDTVAITVTAVNDAPTIDLDANDSSGATGADYQLTYTEQSGPRLIVDTTDAVLADIDSANLASLTVTITNPDFDGSVEFLSADTTGTSIVATYNSGAGVLTLNGADSVANYQQVLRTVRYENTSDAPSANPRAITFVASDGGAASGAATATVTINPVNDAPTAVIAAPSYAAVENAAPLVLHGTGMSVTDVDALSTSIVDVYLSSISGILSATPGTTGVVVTGSGSPNLKFTGTLAQVNSLLAGGGGATITYVVGSDSPAPTDTLWLDINDRGATGSGGALWGSDSVTVNLTAVNDAPLITLPGTVSTPEDTTLVFSAGGPNQVSITDVDAGGSPVEVTLNVTNGLITLAGTAGLAFSVGDGSADTSMTFTGTVADINTALDGLAFAPAADFNGSAFLSVGVNDLGNSGLGGPLNATPALATIAVTPVNDLPNSTDATVTTLQDTPYAFSVANFGFIDSDVGDTLNAVRVDTLPAAGTLTLSGSAVAASQVIAVADLTAGNLVFTPATGTSGTPYAAFAFSVQDSAGAFDASPNTLTVNVTPPANNPPAGTDATVATPESTDYVFTVADFGFSDPDAGDAMSAVRVDMPPTQGTLLLSGSTVTAGQVIAATDVAAGNLVFSPVPATTGSPYASFTFTVYDTNGPDFDPTPNTLTVNVTPVSNSPVNAVPGAQTVNEDTALAIGGISVTDPNGDLATAQLTVGNGAISVSLSGGATVSAGANGSATLTLAGTQAQINFALASLAYQGNPNFSGADVLTLLSTDAGGNTDSDTVDITVASVNDAPTATVPAGYAVTEGSSLALAGTGLAVNDVDSGISSVTVTLAVNAGVLQVSGPPTVTISGSGAPVVTLDGAVADINSLLATGVVNYLVSSDAPPSSDTLTLSITDNGASGAGGPRSAVASTTIAITAVNDAPVNTLPGGSTTLEDTPVVYAGATRISVTDVDAGGAPLQVTLNVSNGVVTLGGVAGLTFTSGGDGAAFMTFNGTVASINAALNGLVFAPNLNYNGLAFITMTTNDLGASGTGGAQTDTDLATIDVLPVNDAPDGTDTTVTAIEDTPYTFSLGNFGFNDVDSTEGDYMTAVRIDTVTLPAGATLQLNTVDVVAGQIINPVDIANGLLVFTPVPDANGANYASFTFSVRDAGVPPGPTFDPVPNTMTIDVAPVNDAPVITSYAGAPSVALTQAENGAAVGTVTASDIDLPPQTLTYSISGGADAALFTVNPTTGVLAFVSAPNFEAPADAGANNVYDVTVRVSDGNGGSDTQAFSVTVTDINDAPTAGADAYSLNEDSTLTVSAGSGVLANDGDEDGDPITLTLVAGPSYGSLSLNADGSFIYTPNANFFGTDTFVYRLSDGGSACK